MVRDRWRWLLSGATLLVHLAVAGRYDFFRDELYFIMCGRRPAWGYVDQPPLVPLLTAASQAFGEHLVLLRALSALAAAATVWVTMALARRAGARDFGAALAGTAAAIAPMYLGLMTTVGTTTFEPLMWTLLVYVVLRALDEPRLWPWAGVVVGIDLEIKYELPVFLVPLVIGLVASGRARALRSRRVALAAAIAIVIAAPSLVWQLAHGLPFVEMEHNQAHQGKNVALGPLGFVGQQALVMNPLLAPLWLAGAIAPFVDARFAKLRFASIAFALTFVAMLLLHAKDYLVTPLYGSMFAVGGAAAEAWVRSRVARASYVAAALVVSALVAPLAMPILPEAALVRWQRALHLAPKPTETLRQGELPQTFADMHGWRGMTERMTEAVRRLPPDEQRRVVILAHNYGEAGAFEFFGRDLPPVVTGHNSYYLWSRSVDTDEIIAFNRDVKELAPKCRQAIELGHFYAPWVMPFEDDSAITLCRGLHPSLAGWWNELKFYY